MSLSDKKYHSHGGFVETTVYNSHRNCIGKKKFDLRIYFKKVLVLKVSYFWNNSRPKSLAPTSISFEGQTYYFSTIKTPCNIGKNSLTIRVEVWDLDGRIEEDDYTFDINVEG